HNQFDVATRQLERAIILYLEEADYYSAATLAGASEEILGCKLKTLGGMHALDSMISAITEIQTANDVQPLNRKKLRDDVLNEVRNWLKHYRYNEDLDFDDRDAAASLIDRAVSNYFKLTGQKTPTMIRFTNLDSES